MPDSVAHSQIAQILAIVKYKIGSSMTPGFMALYPFNSRRQHYLCPAKTIVMENLVQGNRICYKINRRRLGHRTQLSPFGEGVCQDATAVPDLFGQLDDFLSLTFRQSFRFIRHSHHGFGQMENILFIDSQIVRINTQILDGIGYREDFIGF